jgi:two-component system sensor histidine kinase KdpD
MIDDDRPNPDALLTALNKAEKSERSGKLSVFFGMAAGAGKTYAMLEAAQSLLREGIDVVIGVVETHRRAETEALLTGLPVIPRRKTDYKGAVLEEMNLDEILHRRPALVLVDELAHSNVPGSRHDKRWQDVLEILDAGIDVYTTLNVQHIESRKEDVEAITGITIRETVPDSILERAARIELIDITPEELIKRLGEGKVYLGDMAERAAANFFRDDRLSALREMALRLTAEKVENDLRALLTLKGRISGWRSTERIMVAISHSPTSENLIRTTRRIAFSLDAPWIAVHVDTGATLTESDRAQLAKNLGLVRELGGEIVSTAGPDIAGALKRVAEQRGITQIVFGRPTRNWLKSLFSAGTPLDRLVSESGSFDVLILRQDTPMKKPRGFWPMFEPQSGLLAYWYLIWIIGAVALINVLLNPVIGYKAAGFVFLLSILIISLFVSLGPILFAAILSALIWDFFFIPPQGTFHIQAPEDIIMGLAYFVVAVVTGTLTHRIRRREKMLRQREERTQALYEIVRVIASETAKEKFIEGTTTRLGPILGADCLVLLADSSGNLIPTSAVNGPFELGEQEMAVAKYSFNSNKPSGWSTDTLASAESMYLPLQGTSKTVGVLVYRPRTKTKLVPEESNFLNTVARQLAIGIEREMLNEEALLTGQLKESQRLQQTILDSISHEIRTPLTAVVGAASALQDEEIITDDATRRELTDQLAEASERLNSTVGNLLDTSRLSSGMIQLKMEWCDPRDLISISLERMGKILEKNRVEVKAPQKLPLIFVDMRLLEQAFTNLLRNSAALAATDCEISIEAKAQPDYLFITIADNGPGIPAESLGYIFERFYRVPGTPAGGVGLGLWLVKNIVEIHGGRISVSNRPGGGAVFMIQLPLESQPEPPADLSPQKGN